MPAPSDVRAELEKESTNPTSRYFKCARECIHILEQELLDFNWYSPESVEARVESRVKAPQETLDKLDRNGPVKVGSIEELETKVGDIVGARVVLDYIDHAEELAARLEEFDRWEVKKSARAKHKSGYRAVRHIDVRIDLGRHGTIRAEVQVRTRLEEAWGIWSHPIYEVMRNRRVKQPPTGIVRELKTISDSLRAADKAANKLRSEFESWKEGLN